MVRNKKIIAAVPLEDTEWPGDSVCMREDCTNDGAVEVESKYRDEPEKRFYSVLCASCAREQLDEFAGRNL